MRKAVVRLGHWVNKNGVHRFYLSWRIEGATGTGYDPLSTRTPPNPTQRDIREAWKEATEAQVAKERELRGEREYIAHMALPRAAEKYLHHLRTEGYSASTIRRAEAIADQFVEYVRDSKFGYHASSISRRHMAIWRDYLLERGLSGSTVGTALATISGMFRYLFREGHVSANPCDDLRRPQVEGGRAVLPFHGAAELWAFLDRVEVDFNRAAIAIAALTGLRVGELAHLKWSDYDPGANTLTIRPYTRVRSNNKRHDRVLPVPAVLRPFLLVAKIWTGESEDYYVVGGGRGELPMTSQLNTWLKPFGIGPHGLRRWYRSSMETVVAGMKLDGALSVFLLDDLMGHRTSKVRAAYTEANNLAATRPLVEAFSAWVQAGLAELPAQATL